VALAPEDGMLHFKLGLVAVHHSLYPVAAREINTALYGAHFPDALNGSSASFHGFTDPAPLYEIAEPIIRSTFLPVLERFSEDKATVIELRETAELQTTLCVFDFVDDVLLVAEDLKSECRLSQSRELLATLSDIMSRPLPRKQHQYCDRILPSSQDEPGSLRFRQQKCVANLAFLRAQIEQLAAPEGGAVLAAAGEAVGLFQHLVSTDRAACRQCGIMLARSQLLMGDYSSAFQAFRDDFHHSQAKFPDVLSHWKLTHDVEQVDWLHSKGLLNASSHRIAKAGFGQALESIPSDGIFPFHSAPVHIQAALQHAYAAAGQYPNPTLDRRGKEQDARAGGSVQGSGASGMIGAILNPALNLTAIQAQYLRENIVVIDNVLSPEVLAAARLYCMEATVWGGVKRMGYLGAYFQEGFTADIIYQIAAELESALPKVMGYGKHTLNMAWAYKYDSERQGIQLHVDEAAVNANLWLTQDSANLDHDSGGMVIYRQEPPIGTPRSVYNNQDMDHAKVQRELQAAGGSMTVAYKQNRMVLFKSNLWHVTSPLEFRKGYDNRRINLTYLFGQREAVMC